MSVAAMCSAWGPTFPAGPAARLVALALADAVSEPPNHEVLLTPNLLTHLADKTGMDPERVRSLLAELDRVGVIKDFGTTLEWRWGL